MGGWIEAVIVLVVGGLVLFSIRGYIKARTKKVTSNDVMVTDKEAKRKHKQMEEDFERRCEERREGCQEKVSLEIKNLSLEVSGKINVLTKIFDHSVEKFDDMTERLGKGDERFEQIGLSIVSIQKDIAIIAKNNRK